MACKPWAALECVCYVSIECKSQAWHLLALCNREADSNWHRMPSSDNLMYGNFERCVHTHLSIVWVHGYEGLICCSQWSMLWRANANNFQVSYSGWVYILQVSMLLTVIKPQ